MITPYLVRTRMYSPRSFREFGDEAVYSWEEIRNRLQDTVIFSQPISLHLIRHAQSEVNAQKRITGAQDVKLSLHGIEQAKCLGRQLDHSYDLAFASNLQRSQKTLEIACEDSGIRVRGCYRDRRLNERSLGVLEGQKWHWIPAFDAGDLEYAPPQGESYAEVARRVLSFLIDLAALAASQSSGKVIICGHMGPMRIMMGILEERPDSASVLRMTFSNAEVTKVVWKRLQMPEFLKHTI